MKIEFEQIIENAKLRKDALITFVAAADSLLACQNQAQQLNIAIDAARKTWDALDAEGRAMIPKGLTQFGGGSGKGLTAAWIKMDDVIHYLNAFEAACRS